MSSLEITISHDVFVPSRGKKDTEDITVNMDIENHSFGGNFLSFLLKIHPHHRHQLLCEYLFRIFTPDVLQNLLSFHAETKRSKKTNAEINFFSLLFFSSFTFFLRMTRGTF